MCRVGYSPNRRYLNQQVVPYDFSKLFVLSTDCTNLAYIVYRKGDSTLEVKQVGKVKYGLEKLFRMNINTLKIFHTYTLILNVLLMKNQIG